ncbi:MAG: hypothetical protein IJB91_04290 [Oscillospiraceae bacterium]|nr:hypothetical protein [Oscillospiraceae bacterium]
MSVCTFFGHRECCGLDKAVLRSAIEDLIKQGTTEFLVGNHGQFDGMVFSCLQDLSKEYPEISYSVVLAYLPTRKEAYDLYQGHSFYPEGQELGPAKYAIHRRNRYLIRQADICMCYVNQTFGGACKFARMAKNHGLRLINLGSARL